MTDAANETLQWLNIIALSFLIWRLLVILKRYERLNRWKNPRADDD